MIAPRELASESEAIALLKELVRTPSINPRGAAPDGVLTGESRAADVICRWARARGLHVELDTVADGRMNVLLSVDVGSPETVLLETHLDTVEVENASDPESFSGEVIDGLLYGRGACDAKGPLVSFLTALAQLNEHRDELAVNVTLAAVADEEHLYRGVLRLLEHPKMARVVGAIVGEPTGLIPVIAHKGCTRFSVTYTGRSGHSSVPDESVNAIEGMLAVIRVLHEYNDAVPSDPLVGPATLVVTRIAGGEGPNVVPGTCAIDIDRRTLPGEDPYDVRNQIVTHLTAQFGSSVTCSAPFAVDFSLMPIGDSALTTELMHALTRRAMPSEGIGVSFGTDASKLARHGINAVVFGPGAIDQAHSSHESIEVAEVLIAAELVTETVLNLSAARGDTSERKE